MVIIPLDHDRSDDGDKRSDDDDDYTRSDNDGQDHDNGEPNITT